MRAAGDIDRVLAKAVLAGLIRHPAEIARHMEVLGSFRLADGALGRLFEAVVDVALEDRALDSGASSPYWRRPDFGQIAERAAAGRSRLPYSFTQDGADPERARADLDEAIAILVARPEVDAALASGDGGDAKRRRHDAAFERQMELLREQRALEERLANLMQANE